MKVFDENMKGRKWRHAMAVGLLVFGLCTLCLTSNLYALSVTDNARKVTLENGLTVILKEDHSASVAAMQVWVMTGSANETEEEAGITHLIEHMIFKGTPSRKMGEIAKTIEASGGNINAYTSFDRTVYYVEIAGSHFDIGLDVLLDAVQHSLFDEGELAKEKEVVLEEYRRSLDIPERELGKAAMALSYGKHYYGRPIIGYEETIRSFDRQAILKYMDKWYVPENMVLVAVGDFDSDSALEKVRNLMKDFRRKPVHQFKSPVEPPQTALRKTVKKDRVKQVYMNLLWHIPSISQKEIYPLDLLEVILGQGRSSRLYNRMKMDTNLVYSVDAGTYALKDPGVFSIDATLGPEKLKEALEVIGEEMRRVVREPVSPAELTKAKTIAEAGFVFDLEDMSGQARTLGFFQTMTGNMDNADSYLERLKQVTAEDILQAARSCFRPENLTVGVLVPSNVDFQMDDQTLAGLFRITDSEPVKTALSGEKDLSGEMVVLENGMRVIIKENHRLPEVSFSGVFLGGTRLETQGKWGISNFTAQMLTRGTKKRSASEIASTVESWAGSLSAFSGRNSLGVSGKFLSQDTYGGLELMADIVLNPDFPEEEMGKVREDILAGIKAKEDRPMAQLFDLFYHTLYRSYPYGHPSSGTMDTIGSMTRTDLKDWYGKICMPSNFVLAVVGDVKKEQMIPFIETLFGTFTTSVKTLPPVEPEPALTKAREAYLNRPGAQTHMVAGYLGVDFRSSDDAAMALVKTALSGQGGSLFYNLRDKQSLAYAVAAFRSPGLETGAFGVYLGCDPGKVATARKAIFEELEKIRENGISDVELKDAKNYLVGNMQIDLQTNGSKAMQMSLNELYGLGFDHHARYLDEIRKVTMEDVRKAVAKVIVPDRYVFVTVGPAPL